MKKVLCGMAIILIVLGAAGSTGCAKKQPQVDPRAEQLEAELRRAQMLREELEQMRNGRSGQPVGDVLSCTHPDILGDKPSGMERYEMVSWGTAHLKIVDRGQNNRTVCEMFLVGGQRFIWGPKISDHMNGREQWAIEANVFVTVASGDRTQLVVSPNKPWFSYVPGNPGTVRVACYCQ